MPRRALLFVLSVSALSCKTVATETRDPARAATSDAPRIAASIVADAAPAPALEPLAWGTRPAETGALFPVVDGMCIHGEIWPTKGSALYTYGNGTGAFTRGDTATVARLVDGGLEAIDIPTSGPNAEAWGELAPMHVEGTWPGPLFIYSLDGGGGRMRDWPTIWTHGADGFKVVATHHETKSPNYDRPTVFRGNLVTMKRDGDNGDFNAFTAYPFEAGATAIPNLAALGRPKFLPQEIASNDTTLFVRGTLEDKDFTQVVRTLTDGSVKEIPFPAGDARIVATRPSLLLVINASLLIRLSGDKFVPVKLPFEGKVAWAAVDKMSSIWALPQARKSVFVIHDDGKAEELVIPAPVSPRPAEAVAHWPTSGSLLAGVEVDDPYVIGEAGSLYHLDGGKWIEVPLPNPPFAANGKYQAQAVVVPAKGDVYVNAGYAEKGVGWRTPERYRAVLRNRRPKEVLRCNEPHSGSNGSSGHGFMSFPPVADDACTTPTAVLLRLGYDVTEKTATYVYDRKSDYPSVREAIKATPSLGSTVDLVEFVSGTQRYLAARVPSVAAGRELALGVAKRVVGYTETRPEVVCGTPKAERVIHVDVATGKVATP